MCFNQDGAISFLSKGPLKLVEQFIYLDSNILSTENTVSIHIGKAWTVIDGLEI